MIDDKPVIEFPCEDYPIKVIALSSDTLRRAVLEIVSQHASFQQDNVEERPSSKGNYTSVRVSICATGETQLKALHEQLMALPNVKMVL